MNKTAPHIPVLLDETIKLLAPSRGESYLDLTAGYGGHAAAIFEHTQAPNSAVLVDRDRDAINYLKDRFDGVGTKIIHSDYLTASQELVDQARQFNLILADLGVSSLQFDNEERGFSLKQNGPLDMRMDQSQSLSAKTIINTYSKNELIDIFRKFGEESKADKIASAILENRPISTTIELANLVAKNKWQKGKIHPATAIFQAVRIEVNNELEQLAKALPLWIKLLKPEGRLAVISFHSLEDRLVKQFFTHRSGDRYDAVLKNLTKKPITATKSEIVHNPRARSAKLRAVAKIKT